MQLSLFIAYCNNIVGNRHDSIGNIKSNKIGHNEESSKDCKLINHKIFIVNENFIEHRI